jgi:nascent polypeptide-associated complex subunit alpha
MFGIKPGDIKRLKKQLGIDINEIQGVEKIIFEFKDRKLIITKMQIFEIKAGQQKIYQIVPESVQEIKEESSGIETVEIKEEDVKFIIQQTGKSEEEVIRILKEEKGDVAKTILRLLGSS